MTKDFIPYEQALELKELGFDEPCFGYYRDNLELIWKSGYAPWINSERNLIDNNFCTAPTYSQAFRWFREKYSLISYVHPLALLQDTKKWCYEITNFENSWDEDSDLHTLEEAELDCLQKLIQIVKDEHTSNI